MAKIGQKGERMIIIPAINTNDTSEALDLIFKMGDIVLPNGNALESVQIDINDGTFENVKTIIPEAISEIDTKLKFDYHLMVENPILWIERCIRGQAERVIGHIEKMQNQLEFVEKATELGVKVGFALDIDTPLSQIDDTLLTSIDVILLMTYPAGAGGKNLDERIFEKIERLLEIKERDTTPFKICLDGGISEDNIKRVKLAKVDEVAMTKRILEGDIEENLENFYKAMY